MATEIPDKTGEAAHYSGILKSAAVMSLMTLMSRILGLVRDMVQAAFIGTTYAADAFRIASIIPNTLRRLLGEGAMTAAFVPTYAEVEKNHGRERLWRFVNGFFVSFTIVLALVVIAGELLAPFLVDLFTSNRAFSESPEKLGLAVSLTRIIFPYVIFISLSSMLMAVLNSLGSFAPSAFTAVLFNICMIASTVYFGLVFEDPVLGLAIGFLIGGIAQVLFQIPFIIGKNVPFQPVLGFNDPYVRQVFRLMVPGLFAVGISQINMMVNTNILSGLGEGALAGIYYSNRLTELTQGIFAISVATVILPLMSRQAKAGEFDEMKRSIAFAMRMIIFISIPSAVGLAILREPIVSILFQRGEFDQQSLRLSSDPLLYFSIGLLFFAMVKVFVPAYYALKKMHIPVMVSFVDMLVNVSLALWLSTFMGNAGVALALACGATVNVLLLITIFVRKQGALPFSEIAAGLLRTAISSLVMGGVCYLLMTYLNLLTLQPGMAKTLLTLATIVAGAAVFIVMNLLLQSREMKELRQLLVSRKPVIGDTK